MASLGYIESLLNSLDAKIKLAINKAFEHAVKSPGYQIGGIAHQEKAQNFKWIRLDSVTSSVANQEFTIAHGIGSMPIYAIPLVPLESSGVWLPRLKVTRPADASRIYLSSPDTGAAFTVLVET